MSGQVFNSDSHFASHLEEASFHAVFPLPHPEQIETYGTYGRGVPSEMGQSIRYGRDDTRNVTYHDNKRPKERSRDRAYKTRFSMDSVKIPRCSPNPPLGEHTWPREEGTQHQHVVSVGRGQVLTPASPLPPSISNRGPGPSQISPRIPFEIVLTYEGNSVGHRVWQSMEIAQLMADAGAIFGLDPNEIVLLLFSMFPVMATLRRYCVHSTLVPVVVPIFVVIYRI